MQGRRADNYPAQDGSGKDPQGQGRRKVKFCREKPAP
jgi:hypothetical protein